MSVTRLWDLPVPSTGLLGRGPIYEKRLGREVAIRFQYEGDEHDLEAALVFEGVEALRITYMTACDQNMRVAYDRLVDRGDTDWLASVRTALSDYGAQTTPVRHLMILFDGGPCYEVICRSFRIEQNP